MHMTVNIDRYIEDMEQWNKTKEENEILKSRIEKAIEYLNTRLEEYKNSGLSKKYINCEHYYKIIIDLLNILNGRSDE